MKKVELYRLDGTLYKVLSASKERLLVIDCTRGTMPKWVEYSMLESAEKADIEELQLLRAEGELNDKELAQARRRYAMVAGILPFMEDDEMRNMMINRMAEINGKNRRTIPLRGLPSAGVSEGNCTLHRSSG